jgi:predicted house-cleaning noncanonical NTP pyrophosphatase (MazG superfamily)
MSTLPKLVRDNIPELIIKNENKIPVTRELSLDEYKIELLKKLQEETTEVINSEDGAPRLEELADLMELIKAIAALDNATLEDIELLRSKKAEERGGFEMRILLEEIREG